MHPNDDYGKDLTVFIDGVAYTRKPLEDEVLPAIEEALNFSTEEYAFVFREEER